jgi:hypothetical protein
MANSSGGDADDPKQKHGNGFDHSRQQHAAGVMRFSYRNGNEPPRSVEPDEHTRGNGSVPAVAGSYNPYYDDAASDDWQSSSSPSSTRQMLGGFADDDHQGNHGSSRSAAGRRRRLAPVAFVKKIDWA